MTAFAKGSALERAVRVLEETILRSSPNISEQTYKIEANKILVLNGVRNEIDIFVSLDLADGYKSIFIFECKNWKPKVSKNEIIIFAKKIEDTQAQRVFFIGKSFTADALAQAAQFPKLELMRATEHDAALTPTPFNLQVFVEDSATASIELDQPETNSDLIGWKPIDIATATVIVKGMEMPISAYCSEWANDLKSRTSFVQRDNADGEYERSVSEKRKFSQGEFQYEGRDASSATLQLVIKGRVVRPGVISHFEIATRGRVIRLAPIPFKSGSLEFGFVSRPASTS